MDDTGFVIPPKLYDFLKYIALVILPAIASLVLALGVLLTWEGGAVVANVVTLVDTFLGAIIGKSATNFKAQEPPDTLGDLVVCQDHDGTPLSMRIVGTKENPVFEENSRVYLNVRREYLN